MRSLVSPFARLGARGCAIAVAFALGVSATQVAVAIPEDPYPMVTISSDFIPMGDDWQEDYISHETTSDPTVSSTERSADTDPIADERSVLQLMLTTLRLFIR